VLARLTVALAALVCWIWQIPLAIELVELALLLDGARELDDDKELDGAKELEGAAELGVEELIAERAELEGRLPSVKLAHWESTAKLPLK
jgi:hypothetical protein